MTRIIKKVAVRRISSKDKSQYPDRCDSMGYDKWRDEWRWCRLRRGHRGYHKWWRSKQGVIEGSWEAGLMKVQWSNGSSG